MAVGGAGPHETNLHERSANGLYAQVENAEWWGPQRMESRKKWAPYICLAWLLSVGAYRVQPLEMILALGRDTWQGLNDPVKVKKKFNGTRKMNSNSHVTSP